MVRHHANDGYNRGQDDTWGVAKAGADQRRKHSAAFGHGRAKDQYHHQPQRREAGQRLRHLGHQPRNIFLGKQAGRCIGQRAVGKYSPLRRGLTGISK